jgi:hypothetical protein
MVVFILNGSATKYVWKDETLTGSVGEEIEIMADNITLDLNGYGVYGNGSGTGILIENKTNVFVKNGSVENWNNGITLNGSSYCTIDNILTMDCRTGIRVQGSSSNEFNYIQKSASWCSGDPTPRTGGQGFAVRDGESIRVTDCEAWLSSNDGMDDEDSYDTWFYECTVYDCGNNGIELDRSSHPYFYGCSSYNNRDGVDIMTTSYGLLWSSTMNDNSKDGLRFETEARYNEVYYCSGTGNGWGGGGQNLDDQCQPSNYIDPSCNFP